MYTIQDLANGKCAVKNDGTLEELKAVLNAAFLNDNSIIIGNETYYLRYNNSELWFAHDDTAIRTKWQSVKMDEQQSELMDIINNFFRVLQR